MRHPHSRREFVKRSAVAALAAGMPIGVAGQARTAEPALLAELRKKAQARRRRLIFNDDGCGPIAAAGCRTANDFLYGPQGRMGPLIGTQVDSVFMCSGATHVVNHRSSVAETYADVIERHRIGGDEAAHYRDNMRALEAAGTDAVGLTVDFCKRHGLEVFYSHRINDIHNTFLEYERSTWFREHPEYWLGTPETAAAGVDSPKHWWSALDFEQPQVLDYLCRMQQDVCRRYDLDGVETDYFRSPMFFRPNLEFQPATPAQVDVLTSFQRRLREIHLASGTERCRPILTAARVPAVPAVCRHVGIDIERWLKEGLVDVLTVGGGYVPFTEPLDELRQFTRDAGVPMYPTISASGMRGPENRYSSLEAWRGAAANMWRAGADGIVVFNLFPNGPEPRLMDIGSPETLAGRDKLFVIDPIRVLEGDLVQGIEQNQALPVAVPANGQPAMARLPIGDDLPAAVRQGKSINAELRIRLSNPQAATGFELLLNGAGLQAAHVDDDAGWLTYRPQPEMWRAGPNELTFRATAATDVSHVEVPVAYR